MFELRVSDYNEARRLVAQHWPSHVISLITGTLPVFGPRHLQIAFNDIIRPSPGLVLPQATHVDQLLAFTRDLGDQDRLLVHCMAGINRSPAAAIGILIQHGVEFAEAYRMIAAMRPSIEPNRLLISYIDRRFDLDGALNRLIAHPP